METRGWVAIIGGGRSQLPLIEKAASLGLATLVLDRDPHCAGAARASGFEAISTRDTASLVRAIARKAERADLIGALAYTAEPAALAAAAEINARLDARWFRPSLSLVGAEKRVIKSKLDAAGIPTPASLTTDDPDALDALLRKYGALVVKPAAGGRGSLGVAHVTEPGTARRAFEAAAALSADGTALLEAYVAGPEYSVDGYAVGGECRIFHCARKRNRGPEGGFLMTGFESGEAEDGALRPRLGPLVRSAASALGIADGFFSFDVVESHGGRFFVLDAGVLLDAKIERLLDHVGIDVFGLALALMLGRDAEPARPSGSWGLRFLYAEREGVLARKAPPSLADGVALEWERWDGDRVGVPTSVSDLVATLLARAPTLEAVRKRLAAPAERDLFEVTA